MCHTQPSFGSILAAAALWLVASAVVATAQEESEKAILQRVLELEVELGRMEAKLDYTQRLLAASVQPWRPVAPNIHAFNKWMRSDKRLLNYEFGIMRNGGFRKLTVSTWNGGYRFLTETYLRGDAAGNFKPGASFWIIGTKDPAEATCKGNTVQHYYMGDTGAGLVIEGGNGCGTEGPVYARKRLFEADLP